jgi:O-antigen ligase
VGVPPRLHAVAALTIVPLLAFFPVLGGFVLVGWLWASSRVRSAANRGPAWVMASAVVLVVAMHWRGTVADVITALAAVTAALLITRLDSVVNRRAAARVGIGSALAAMALLLGGVVQLLGDGVEQMTSVAHHPNAAAALAMALVAGSTLALRGIGASRVFAVLGIVSGVVALVLTGSRGGLLGLLAAAVFLLATFAVGRVLARRGRAALATFVVVGVAAGLLLVLQGLLMTPDRWGNVGALAAMWARGWSSHEAGVSLIDRLALLGDPLAAAGGRAAGWSLVVEMIARRPVLGYGFDAIETVFVPGAAAELSIALSHPHHGLLSLLLQGGTVLAVSVLLIIGHVIVRLHGAAVRGDAVAGVVASLLLGLIVSDMLDSVLKFGYVGGPALFVGLMATSDSARVQSCAGD